MPRSDQIPEHMSMLPIITPTSRESSIEGLVILFHVYTLAAATLHRSRRADRYQNTVAGLCVAGVMIWSILLRPPAWEEGVWLLLAWLPTILALGLSLSAIAHDRFGVLAATKQHDRLRGEDKVEGHRSEG